MPVWELKKSNGNVLSVLYFVLRYQKTSLCIKIQCLHRFRRQSRFSKYELVWKRLRWQFLSVKAIKAYGEKCHCRKSLILRLSVVLCYNCGFSALNFILLCILKRNSFLSPVPLTTMEPMEMGRKKRRGKKREETGENQRDIFFRKFPEYFSLFPSILKGNNLGWHVTSST